MTQREELIDFAKTEYLIDLSDLKYVELKEFMAYVEYLTDDQHLTVDQALDLASQYLSVELKAAV